MRVEVNVKSWEERRESQRRYEVTMEDDHDPDREDQLVHSMTTGTGRTRKMCRWWRRTNTKTRRLLCLMPDQRLWASIPSTSAPWRHPHRRQRDDAGCTGRPRQGTITVPSWTGRLDQAESLVMWSIIPTSSQVWGERLLKNPEFEILHQSSDAAGCSSLQNLNSNVWCHNRRTTSDIGNVKINLSCV